MRFCACLKGAVRFCEHIGTKTQNQTSSRIHTAPNVLDNIHETDNIQEAADQRSNEVRESITRTSRSNRFHFPRKVVSVDGLGMVRVEPSSRLVELRRTGGRIRHA